MIKKIIGILLTVTMVFGLCSCTTPKKVADESINLIKVLDNEDFDSKTFEKLFSNHNYSSVIHYDDTVEETVDPNEEESVWKHLRNSTAIEYRFNTGNLGISEITIQNVRVYKNLDNTVTAHWTDNSSIKLTIIAPNRDKAEEIYGVATDYFAHHIVEYSLEGDAGSTKANTYHIAKAKDSEGNLIEVVKVIDKGDKFVVEITNYAVIL